MGNYIMLFFSIILAALGQLLMKHGMRIFGSFAIVDLPYKIFPMIFNPFVFFGLAAFGVSAVFWLVVLSRFELSFAYPLVSIGYVLVAFFSWMFFKEDISASRFFQTYYCLS